MKLVRRSTLHTEDLVVTPVRSAVARKLVKLVTGTEPPTVSTTYSGRRSWSRCHIEYEFEIPAIAFAAGSTMNKTDVVFGFELYQGVMPIRHVDGLVYECSVDNVVQVRVGTVGVHDDT